MSTSLFVKEENGIEKRMEILFTFDSEDFQKRYVLFFDPENEGEIFASAYDDEGNLFPVESDEEWQMIEVVLDTFEESEDIEDSEDTVQD